MSSIILGIVFLLICCIAIGLWSILPFLLVGIIVGAIGGITVHYITMKRYENAVVETEIIRIEPITKKQAENTGYSVGYGKHFTYHEHYQYNDIKVGDRVTFRVKWKEGNENTITCKKGDSTYKRLYQKLKK